MSENTTVLEMKKRRLKEELSKPFDMQNKFKIKDLKSSIQRHKKIARRIKEQRDKNRRLKNERNRDRWRKNLYK